MKFFICKNHSYNHLKWKEEEDDEGVVVKAIPLLTISPIFCNSRFCKLRVYLSANINYLPFFVWRLNPFTLLTFLQIYSSLQKGIALKGWRKALSFRLRNLLCRYREKDLKF